MSGILINNRSIQVAGWVVEVDTVEQVELPAQLNVLCFAKREAFDDGEVHVRLLRPAQDVAADIAEVSSGRARDGCSVRAWDQLTGQHDRSHKGVRVEEVSGRDIAGRRIARRSCRPVQTESPLFAPK